MRKALWWAVAAFAISLAAFFVVAPGVVERSMNKVVPVPMPPVDPTNARRGGSPIVDMHADTLLWSRDLLERSARGQVDLPRLVDGDVALQIFSSVTKTPKGQNYDSNGADSDNITALVLTQLQPVRTWKSLLERSLWHATKLRRAARRSGGQLRLVTNATELDGLLTDRRTILGQQCAAGRPCPVRPVGGMLSLEGLQPLEGRLANIDRLHAAGFRMAGLAHFFDNEVAGSMHGRAKGGLTPFGVQAIRRMEAIGMIVDVAHASHAALADVIRIARRPVVSSHGGVQATCKVNRNLTDDEIRGIARTGGVVGIGYWEAATCSTDPRAIVRAIAHVRDVGGIDHVGLGSDFDGAVTTAFDAGQLAVIRQALDDAGFDDRAIAKVMGGNVLRVLRAGMQPLPPTGSGR